jgi:hypothetical protein
MTMKVFHLDPEVWTYFHGKSISLTQLTPLTIKHIQDMLPQLRYQLNTTDATNSCGYQTCPKIANMSLWESHVNFQFSSMVMLHGLLAEICTTDSHHSDIGY